jgi:6-phosphogluconolactonase/glucosamine-6-phosphate isomerase/deaminase
MKKKMIALVTLAAVLLFGAGVAVGAAGNEPGSSTDPLVSKSYVDSKVATVTKSSGYREVTLSKGKQLVCDAGTQLVVVSGTAKATAVLSDITQGSALSKNKQVSANHSYIVTKDNSGIKATKSTTVFVFGTYSIK